MPNDPPQIYLCAASRDRPFVENLSQRLRSRGLGVYEGGELGEPASPEQRQRAMEDSRLVLVVVSRDSARAEAVAADYHAAQTRSYPLIPLIVSSVKDLPRDLSHVQAIDCNADEHAGWASLLLALDALGIARYPIAMPPDLDAEVVLARAFSGLTPPTWYVSRLPVVGPRRLSSWTVYGATVTILLGVLGFLATHYNPLIAIPVLYTLYQLYVKFSPVQQRIQKDGKMVILTPEGTVTWTGTVGVSAAFRDATDATDATATMPATSATTPATMRADDVMLQVYRGSGRPPVHMTLGKLLAGGALAQQGLALYNAYIARYRSGAHLPPVATGTAPLLFISYSRRDAALVDRLELSLQRAGYNVWVDRGNLTGGQEWSAQIQEAIDQCAAMVVVISPDAIRSAEVEKEYQSALKLGKPVFGALARTTYRIPAALRQRPICDHRQGLLFGIFALADALAMAGIAPLPTFGALPGARIAHSSMLAVAQTLHGNAPTESSVYRTSLPARFPFSLALLLVVAAVSCWFAILAGSPYLIVVAGILVFGVGWPTLLFLRRRLRFPDTIIIFPEGYITFFKSAYVSEHPFDGLSAVTIAPPSLFRGATLVNTGIGGHKPYHVPIRPGFHQSRRIAEEIVATFNRYKSQASASLDHGAQT